MTQARDKWNSVVLSLGDFSMIRKRHDFPYFHFYFSFRNVIREQLDENDFCRCYSIFFRKSHSESTWSQPCSKLTLNDYEGHWQRHLKDTLQLKISWTLVNIGAKPAPRHLTIIACFSSSQTDLVFKVNLVLIEWFSLQFIYLSTFSIFCVSWSS